MPVPLRPAVSGLPAYVAGRPAPERDDLVTYKLSSNENPFPPLPGVLDAVAEASRSMNRYPDIANALVAEAVAARLGVTADRLAFGTGSVGVLYHLLQAVCGPDDEVVHAWRSFEAYPISVLLTGARWVGVPLATGAEHDLDAMLAAVGPRTRAVLLCSPNNPTGPALRHDEVLRFVEAVGDDVLVVVDEAYVEFVTDPAAVRGLEVAQGHDNVVVLRTFSKAYGLAGFRVGYCVAEPRLAQAVRSVALPFGVSLPAQAAVLASLQQEAALLERVAALVERRDALLAGLRERGLDVPDAQGNFVWLPAEGATADVAATFAEAGLVVRPYVSGQPGDGVRITVGEPEANARVLDVAARLGRGSAELSEVPPTV
ncbi:histidinol-phosphate transaminase [Microlunatus flavus]|uniref:Aromatic amino acid aminotransferase n=1 Tax=Microlunatus flavus TaxID=1036181 RepID=A0A1H8Z7K4_9ACTN|nr:histidinol-phosphate transaminase [Microlunatus flavus]SEP60414.1 histidinol-phosphate aminotransferase [Microlunatus flavus]